MSEILEKINEYGVLTYGQPVKLEEIIRAERELGLTFADEYCQYVAEYGAIRICGLALTGVTGLSVNDVVEITKEERKYNKNIPSNMYVVEEFGVDSIVILQDEKGYIYICSPNHRISKIFDSLAAYVEQAAKEYEED